jgi:hypothetical protein
MRWIPIPKWSKAVLIQRLIKASSEEVNEKERVEAGGEKNL